MGFKRRSRFSPLTARTTADEIDPSAFQQDEVHFLNNMRRQDRDEVLGAAKRQRVVAEQFRNTTEEPLRISVLRSKLPEDMKMSVFAQLSGTPSDDRYTRWVRQLVRVPVDTPHVSAVSHLSPSTGVALASAAMDARVTGCVEDKREMLKIVCQQLCGAQQQAPTLLGVEGGAGVGKSHFARHAIAAALGRPLACIPLSGALDASYLIGRAYAHDDGRPGRLVSAIIEAGCSNPILLFDDVDKIPHSARGDEITSLLLDLTDQTVRDTVRDRYLHGLDLNLSTCEVVFTYTDASLVPPVLLDRLRRIAIPPSTVAERVEILQRHVIPRVCARLRTNIEFSQDAVEGLVHLGDGGDLHQMERDVENVITTAQLAAVQTGIDPNSIQPIPKDFVDSQLAYRTVLTQNQAPPVGMYC